MNAIDEYRLEGEKAMEEKKSREVVTNILNDLPDLPLKKIAKIAGVSIYFVRKIKKELQEKKS